MDKVHIAEGVECLNIGGEYLFRCFGKLIIVNQCNCRYKAWPITVEALRMKGNFLLRFAGLMEYRIGLLHLLNGLVKVVEDHHDHFLFCGGFMAPVDDG